MQCEDYRYHMWEVPLSPDSIGANVDIIYHNQSRNRGRNPDYSCYFRLVRPDSCCSSWFGQRIAVPKENYSRLTALLPLVLNLLLDLSLKTASPSSFPAAVCHWFLCADNFRSASVANSPQVRDKRRPWSAFCCNMHQLHTYNARSSRFGGVWGGKKVTYHMRTSQIGILIPVQCKFSSRWALSSSWICTNSTTEIECTQYVRLI